MAIINRNAVKFVYRFCVNVFFSLLDKILRSGLLDYVVSVGILYKKLSMFFRVAGSASHQLCLESSCSSVILASTCYYIRHSNRYVVLAYCGFNLHLLNDCLMICLMMITFHAYACLPCLYPPL